MKFISQFLFLIVILVNLIYGTNSYCAPWEESFIDDNKHCDVACIAANCSYGFCANDNASREFACKCVGTSECNNGNQWLNE